MDKKELQSLIDEIDIKGNCEDIIDNAIGTLMFDPIATKNFLRQIVRSPLLLRDALYWNKFYMFITGVKRIEEDLEQGVKLSNKLFDNPQKKKENGMRLLGLIDKADTEQKVKYYINVTRSLLIGYIDSTNYFRVMKAISETLNEDLEYLIKLQQKKMSLEEIHRF